MQYWKSQENMAGRRAGTGKIDYDVVYLIVVLSV